MIQYFTLRYWYYKLVLGAIDHKCLLLNSIRFDGCKSIFIYGDKDSKTVIGRNSWLAAKSLTGRKECMLVIGAGSKIGNFNHIFCTSSIIIKNNVLTADKVFISDNLHSYEDVSKPVFKQPIKQMKDVVIGEGAWLGENVCIIGASVGKGSVIGANSVVTKDIPDYCVAIGAPARIIKRYNLEMKRWEMTV